MQFPSLRVDGQVALVTGTGTGIGQACALALAAVGASIVLTELPDRLAAAEATARTDRPRILGAETLVRAPRCHPSRHDRRVRRACP